MCKEQGIAVTVLPGYNSSAVAELCLALALSVSRKVPQLDKSMRAGKPLGYLERMSRGLDRKTVGLVGMGNIAREVARKFVVSATGNESSLLELIFLSFTYRELSAVRYSCTRPRQRGQHGQAKTPRAPCRTGASTAWTSSSRRAKSCLCIALSRRRQKAWLGANSLSSLDLTASSSTLQGEDWCVGVQRHHAHNWG